MKSHPIWDWKLLTVCGLVWLGSLWIFATEFDETEIKSWTTGLTTIATIVAARYGWQKFKKAEATND